MLGEFPRNTWHARWTLGEYFSALMEELDEHAFLCYIEVVRHICCLLRVQGVDLYFLSVIASVKCLISQYPPHLWRYVVIDETLRLEDICVHPEGH
jgi:hypothetical protein